MSRWTVTGIPNGESGNYKIEQCTKTTGEPSWLNYVNFRNIAEGNYTVLYRKFGESWLNIMQDTEQEYGEHDWLTTRMSGHVLIAGLGIGMIHIPLLAIPAFFYIKTLTTMFVCGCHPHPHQS